MSISITQDIRDMVFKGPMSSSDMKHYDEPGQQHLLF